MTFLISRDFCFQPSAKTCWNTYTMSFSCFMQSDILYYITIPSSNKFILWNFLWMPCCHITQCGLQQILQIVQNGSKHSYFAQYSGIALISWKLIALHITDTCDGICLASWQMTVILWHFLGTVIQCEPKRMQEVREQLRWCSHHRTNNKRMFETIISTKQSQHEWNKLWRWQKTRGCQE
jgi:hypothetical protein